MTLKDITEIVGEFAVELQEATAQAADARFGRLFKANDDGTYSLLGKRIRLPFFKNPREIPNLARRNLRSNAIKSAGITLEIPISFPDAVEIRKIQEEEKKEHDDDSGFHLFHHKPEATMHKALENVEVTLTKPGEAQAKMTLHVEFEKSPPPEGLMILQNRVDTEWRKELNDPDWEHQHSEPQNEEENAGDNVK